MRPPPSAWQGWVLAFSAATLAFSLAAHLTASQEEPIPDSGLLDFLLGESRASLSGALFTEADQYFHRGVAHREPSVSLAGPFRRWQAEITPTQHVHAEGRDSAEILAWLRLSTEADPHNVESFLVAAFWANTGLQRTDLAAGILAEAQRFNPSDYRIALEKGRLAIETHHFDDALTAFQAAQTLYDHTPATPERAREFALDRGEILTFLGFLHEARGETAQALGCFKNTLAIFPERSYIKERIGLLEKGLAPPDSAQGLLEKITRKTVHDACQEAGKHHHEPGDQDHDE